MHIAFRIVTVSMLVLSLGLHWAFLQTVAWTGMLITYAHDASFKEAVAKTFDGKHPCPLCKVIENGRAVEKKQEQQQSKPSSKLDMGLVWQPAGFDFDHRSHDRIALIDFSPISRANQPPKPRPRGVLDNRARA